ncbi:MAG: rod shape-determining protein MreD [Gammaproteobacteria bacterium]|nr:rod shape-determining protein MreD [Gammaproteobacteria bacterium]
MGSKQLNLPLPQARLAILLSYFFCLVLDTLALLGDASILTPPLTLFALLYWTANFLDRTHLFTAFILGLLADTLYQTTLGAHALIFVLITFLMVRHRLRFKSYPVWQQAFFAGLYMMIYQTLNFLFFSPVLDNGNFVPYWTMPAASILLWPVLAFVLKRLTTMIAYR